MIQKQVLYSEPLCKFTGVLYRRMVLLIGIENISLGIQAKRVYCSIITKDFDTEYVTNNDRVDILAKPLSDGSIALSFINLNGETMSEGYSVSIGDVAGILDSAYDIVKMDEIANSSKYRIENLWTGEVTENITGVVEVHELMPYDQVTVRVYPL